MKKVVILCILLITPAISQGKMQCASAQSLPQSDSGIRLMPQLGHSGPVMSVAFSPDGKYLVEGSGDGTGKVWETETGKEVRRFEEHSAQVLSVAFSPDGRYVLTGDSITMRLWEMETGKEVRWFNKRDPVTSV